MRDTIAFPLWLILLALLMGLAWSVAVTVEARAMRWLYEYYRHDRDTLNIQLRDAFIAGADFGKWGEPDKRRIREEASTRFPFAATNPTLRPKSHV